MEMAVLQVFSQTQKNKKTILNSKFKFGLNDCTRKKITIGKGQFECLSGIQ